MITPYDEWRALWNSRLTGYWMTRTGKCSATYYTPSWSERFINWLYGYTWIRRTRSEGKKRG